MKRSRDRILTTHTGSLPRPEDLVAMVQARERGEAYDKAALAQRTREAVREVVQQQVRAGIDVVSDGEYGKPGFFQYVHNRLNGFEVSKDPPAPFTDIDFPSFTEWRRQRGFTGGLIQATFCTGPLSWKDRAAIDTDIANFKHALSQGEGAALDGAAVEEAFLPAASVGIIAQRMPNRYYPSYEAYVEAIAGVMRDEYRAITDAGFILQIDAPEMCIDRAREFRDRTLSDFLARAELWVEALNHALEGISPEQVRFHVCWGNGEGPHVSDVPLADIVGVVLKVNAAAYSVEASNPRHAHEWKLWRDVKLPEGKVLIPGVIDSVTNFVEHPELVADRILNYANIVGGENVIAGTDCGFGTSAIANNVHTPIVWAKLASLREGAERASKQLWGSRFVIAKASP
jgi:5-methyltetrahydropteroyltriglutamate--homocysteine methyltransferase